MGHEDTTPGEPVAPAVASSVQGIVAAAERSAADMHRRAEELATRRAGELEAAATRRADEVVSAAESDSQRLLAAAEVRASQYLAECRRLIDEFAEERGQRLAAVTDRLLVQSEALADRFEAATTLRSQVEELLRRLGEAAETLARDADAAREAVTLPPLSAERRAGEAPASRTAEGG